MNNLVEFNNEKTYTSVYLTEQINLYRGMEGDKAVLKHFTLLQKIEKEFNEEIDNKNILCISYKDSMNRDKPMYELNYEQSLQLLMSESKVVRKGVIKVLKKLSKPKTIIELLEESLSNLKAQEVKLQVANNIIEKQTPKVKMVDSLIDNVFTTSIRDAAATIGINQTKFIELLINKKYLYRVAREPNDDNSSTLRPYAKKQKNKKLFHSEPWSRGSVSGLQTKITTVGLEYFRQRVAKWILEEKESFNDDVNG